MRPTTPTELGLMPTLLPTGLAPVIETRRGIRGVYANGLWTPLPIWGGDGSDDDSHDDDADDKPKDPPEDKSKDPPGDTFSREYVEGLRRENATFRTQNRDLKKDSDRLKDLEKEKLTDTERLQKERDEAVARANTAEEISRQRVLRAEVKITAAELKFHDPDDAFRHIDPKAITVDDDGLPTNVKSLLEELVKAKPYLTKTESDGGAGPTRTPDPAKRTKDDLVTSTEKELRQSGRYSSMV